MTAKFALPAFALLLVACGGGKTAPDAATAPAAASTELTPLQRGATLWKRCRACHNVGEGARHKVGPNLYGIYGMTAGTQADFNYSKAMTSSGIVWDDDTLDAYLEDPRGYIPGNRMSYVGLKRAEDREALLLWLRENAG